MFSSSNTLNEFHIHSRPCVLEILLKRYSASHEVQYFSALSVSSPWGSLLTVGAINRIAGDNKSDDSNVSFLFVF